MQSIPAAVADFLSGKRIVIAGVSRTGRAPANAIFRRLQQCGYEAIPVNPNATELEGCVPTPICPPSRGRCTAWSSPRLRPWGRASCTRRRPAAFAASGSISPSGQAACRPRRSRPVGTTGSSPSSAAARSCTASPWTRLTGSSAGGFGCGTGFPGSLTPAASPGVLADSRRSPLTARRPAALCLTAAPARGVQFYAGRSARKLLA